MHKSISLILAGAAIAAAVPVIASAQPYGRGPGGYGPPGQYGDYGPGRGNDYGRGDYGRGGGAPGSIDQREYNVSQRIEEGARRGYLTPTEVTRLRNSLRDIRYLEDQYRRGGFSNAEVRDLQVRLQDLDNRITREWRDNDQRGDQFIERLRRLDQNIYEGSRGGGLTRSEADRLRADVERVGRIHNDYLRSGRNIDSRERADLNRRLDILANQIQAQRRDGQQRGGYDGRYDGPYGGR